MWSTNRIMAHIGTLVLSVTGVVVVLAVSPKIEGVWGAQEPAETPTPSTGRSYQELVTEAEDRLYRASDQELAATRLVAEALTNATGADKARAKLLLVQTYPDWRGEAIRLCSEVMEEFPNTEWEAWAKTALARTLAQPNTGQDPEPGQQCQRAAALLDEVVERWTGQACGWNAMEALPPIRAYFDFQQACVDLSRLAARVRPEAIEGSLRQMLVAAADGGLSSEEIADQLSQAATDTSLSILVRNAAAPWETLVRLPFDQAMTTAPLDRRRTLLDMKLAPFPDGLRRAWEELKGSAETVLEALPLEDRAEKWAHLGLGALLADDREGAALCLDWAKTHYFNPSIRQNPDAASEVGHLAGRLGEYKAAVDILTDAMTRWPECARAPEFCQGLGALYTELGDKALAKQYREKLYREYPPTRHRDVHLRALKEEFDPSAHPAVADMNTEDAVRLGEVQ